MRWLRHTGLTLFTFALALAWLVPAAPQAQEPVATTANAAAQVGEAPVEWEKQSLQWFKVLPKNGRIVVDNPWGNIYSRFGGYEPKAEILATVQKIDRDVPELEVEFELKGEVLYITTVAPRRDSDTFKEADRVDRVDLVVFVPENITLEAKTTHGSMAIKGLKSDLIAQTDTGDINVMKCKGAVSLTSDRGALSATLQTGVTTKEQKFTTTTGSIEVYMWEDATHRFDLATSGVISTDFSLDIEHRRFEEPGKYAAGGTTKNGSPLILRSKRGNLGIFQLPRDYNPDRDEATPASR